VEGSKCIKLQIERWIDIVMTIFIRGRFHKYIFIHVVWLVYVIKFIHLS